MNSHPPAPALCVASIAHVSLPCPPARHSPGWKQGQALPCPLKAAQPLAQRRGQEESCARPGPEEDREYLLSLLPPVLHRCHLAAAGTNPRDISEHPLGASIGACSSSSLSDPSAQSLSSSWVDLSLQHPWETPSISAGDSPAEHPEPAHLHCHHLPCTLGSPHHPQAAGTGLFLCKQAGNPLRMENWRRWILH